MISDIMGNLSFGELKLHAEDHQGKLVAVNPNTFAIPVVAVICRFFGHLLEFACGVHV